MIFFKKIQKYHYTPRMSVIFVGNVFTLLFRPPGDFFFWILNFISFFDVFFPLRKKKIVDLFLLFFHFCFYTFPRYFYCLLRVEQKEWNDIEKVTGLTHWKISWETETPVLLPPSKKVSLFFHFIYSLEMIWSCSRIRKASKQIRKAQRSWSRAPFTAVNCFFL